MSHFPLTTWGKCSELGCDPDVATQPVRISFKLSPTDKAGCFLQSSSQLFLLEGSSTIYFLCFLIMFFVLFYFLAAWKTWRHCNPSSTTGWHMTPDALEMVLGNISGKVLLWEELNTVSLQQWWAFITWFCCLVTRWEGSSDGTHTYDSRAGISSKWDSRVREGLEHSLPNLSQNNSQFSCPCPYRTPESWIWGYQNILLCRSHFSGSWASADF